MATKTDITATTTVREVMTRYPHSEVVFNKYGLTGCGGRLGPEEPIGFFATVHHVDPASLLQELNDLASTVPPEPAASPSFSEEPDIFRPFVKAALATVLTVGCTLGAVNLAAMALAGVTGSYWEAVTQAHGHAQIFGWAGLFILGVAYHVVPRLKATQLHSRPLAMASFWLLLAAITLRMVSQPFAQSPSFASLVVLSALAELAAASLFLWVMVRTLAANPGSADFWDKYVIASAAWFWVTAAATMAISLYTANAGVAVIPLGLDAPYLHVALMGFVAMMIFGITLRTIPVFMGLRSPNQRAFDAIFWGLNLSIVLKAGSGWFSALRGSDSLAAAGSAGSALEFAAVLAFVYFLGIFGKPERNISEEGASRGYEKFVRTSFFWLVVAATMTAAYALFQGITSQPVPHSLVGAYRHALTVGFISLIIIGMSSRIIPVFTGARLHSDQMLLGTFLLINLGNTIRVLSQPLADLVGGPFFVTMGVSGFIEVTGLGLFVYNLWRTIDATAEEESVDPGSPTLSPITAGMVVADVLKLYPGSLEVFVSHGFTQLRNPIGRLTLARAVTVDQATQMRGVELESLLRDLNHEVAPKTSFTTRETVGTPEGGEGQHSAKASTGSESPISRELVLMALRGCYDPEVPVNIVDLGLIYEVQITSVGQVRVKMTLTAPGCPMSAQMMEEVRETLAQLPGVRDVQLDLIFDPPWTPDRMTEQAKRQLGMRTA